MAIERLSREFGGVLDEVKHGVETDINARLTWQRDAALVVAFGKNANLAIRQAHERPIAQVLSLDTAIGNLSHSRAPSQQGSHALGFCVYIG
jgi:hypothetical protein